LDYDDGTPASTPQMAYDVCNFIGYMQRRNGFKRPDFNLWKMMMASGVLLMFPLKYLKTRGHFRNLLSVRYEMYSVRDGVYYHHLKKGMRNQRAPDFRYQIWG